MGVGASVRVKEEEKEGERRKRRWGREGGRELERGNFFSIT